MSQKLPPIISWDDSWIVGIEEIDIDHKKLVTLISTLFGALISVQAKKYVKETTIELIDYTKYHFKREEEWMESHNYDGLMEHKEAHRKLIEQVLEISKTIIEKGGTEELGDEVYDFLKGWLVNHILDEDMKLKVFIRSENSKEV